MTVITVRFYCPKCNQVFDVCKEYIDTVLRTRVENAWIQKCPIGCIISIQPILSESQFSDKNRKEVKRQMKLKELPREKPRIELKDLPPTNVLKAVGEEVKEAQEGKTGGLVISFIQKDGKQFSQKYGKLHGDTLAEALDRLGLRDTTDLQVTWYQYEMKTFRAGFPRYIPFKKA